MRELQTLKEQNKLALWEHVNACWGSGRTVKDWCKESSIGEHTYWWLRKPAGSLGPAGVSGLEVVWCLPSKFLLSLLNNYLIAFYYPVFWRIPKNLQKVLLQFFSLGLGFWARNTYGIVGFLSLPFCIIWNCMVFLFFRFVPAYKLFLCLVKLWPFQALTAVATISLIFIFHWYITPRTYCKRIFFFVDSDLYNLLWHLICGSAQYVENRTYER